MSDYNLNDLFSEIETATAFTSELYMPKKGADEVLVMLPPLEYKGKPCLFVEVKGDYQGTENRQFMVRFIKMVKGKGWEGAAYVGIPLPSGQATKLAVSRKDGYPLGEQETQGIKLMKPVKLELSILPKKVTVPDELWTNSSELTWEILLEQYNQMQANNKKKDSKPVEDMPF